MKRRNLPNLLLGASTGLASLVLGFLCLRPLLSKLISVGLGETWAFVGVGSYFLSWALLIAGITLTLLWRDTHPTRSSAGPFLFVAPSILLLTIPFLALFTLAVG